MASEEPLLPHPADVPLATAVRGTVILTSLRSLRARGLGDRYMKALAPPHRDAVASVVATAWIPADFALAHYRACDALALDRDTILEIGAEAGRFNNETVLSVLAKLTRESGATPWLVLGYAQKLNARNWVGGSVATWKAGPKEARLEWIQQPCMGVPYFQLAFGAFIRGVCALFAGKVYVRELAQRKPTEGSYRISWV